MAIARRFRITHEEVFGHGAYLVSEVSPVLDFEKSSRETKVQQVDKETGLLLWSVDALDADPEARKQSKTVSVKFAAPHQPVPPANASGMPFTPVVLEGLRALPYVDKNGNRVRRPSPRPLWRSRVVHTGVELPALRRQGQATAGASVLRGWAPGRGPVPLARRPRRRPGRGHQSIRWRRGRRPGQQW